MKRLLMIAAVGEAVTGLMLLAYPAIVFRLLFGEEITDAGILISRVTGISLIALGVACWPDSNLLRAFYAMFSYSTAVMLYLVFAGIGGKGGIMLWPAVAAHAGLSFLLVLAWRNQRKTPEAGM
jgi:hypothetical protein